MATFRPQIIAIVILGFAFAGGALVLGVLEENPEAVTIAATMSGALVTGIGMKLLEKGE